MGPPESTPQMAYRSVQPFLQGCRTRTVQLYSPGCANIHPYVTPWAQPSPQPKGHIDRFSHFAQLMAERSYTFPFPLKIASSHRGTRTPSNTWFRAHNLNGIPIGSAILRSSPKSVPILYSDPPLLPSKCPFRWGIWTASNMWFLGPTRVLNPNGISISWAVFARLTTVTDRNTDRPRYSVCNSIPHLHTSTAMRPNYFHWQNFTLFCRSVMLLTNDAVYTQWTIKNVTFYFWL